MSQIVTEVYDAFRAANVQEEFAKAAAGAIAGREDLVTKLDLEHNVNRMQTEIVDVAWPPHGTGIQCAGTRSVRGW